MGGRGGEGHRRLVLFPFLAQGHISPFVSLAKILEKEHRQAFTAITIVSTPLNIHKLSSHFEPSSSETTTRSIVSLRSLPFHSPDHGLPPDTENTDVLPFPLFLRLFRASLSLRSLFHRLISDLTDEDGRPPVSIIADVFFSWTTEIAKQFGVFHATFWTGGAEGFAAFVALWLHLPHLNKVEEEEFGVPGFPNTYRLRVNQLSPALKGADGKDSWSIVLREQIRLLAFSNGLLCNTTEELETDGLALLSHTTGLPVWPIGPLFFDADAGQRARKTELNSVEDWLNHHQSRTVLYISFGSQNTVSTSSMTTLAEGLEASGEDFIWVIRPPLGYDPKEQFREEWLPTGFNERTKERGLLLTNWAPQIEILSHRAVGAFLSHCGWNSAMESLSKGVPMIGWPLAAEQFYNSKMLERMGVAVEVARGAEGDITRETVEKAVRDVIGGEKGKYMMERAAELGWKINGAFTDVEGKKGCSLASMEDFVKVAKAHQDSRNTTK